MIIIIIIIFWSLLLHFVPISKQTLIMGREKKFSCTEKWPKNPQLLFFEDNFQEMIVGREK